MIKQALKKVIPLSFINYLKCYLIYLPFEKPSNYNGRILNQYHFDINKKDNICIFSYFDKDAIINDYVIYYLQNLAHQGFDIVFVSTSEGLPKSKINKTKSYCQDVLIKENVGYDFGAWHSGITCRVILWFFYRKIFCV